MQSQEKRGTKRGVDAIDLTKEEPRRRMFSTSDLYSTQPTPTQEHTEEERESWLHDDNTNIDEAIASSQEEPDYSDWHKYGMLDTKVVGVQYYDGIAMRGERALLRREPRNPYDRNAIRVDNTAMKQVGHIPRRVAAKLAPYLDNKWLSIECALNARTQFDAPVSLILYGPHHSSDEGKALMERMKADKLPLNVVRENIKREKDEEKERERQRKAELAEARRAAAGLGGGQRDAGEGRFANHSQPEYKDSEMADILENVEKFDPRRAGESAESYGQDEEALANMSMAKQPAAIKTKMLPYQRQALQWLLDQERTAPPAEGSNDIVQLWKRHNSNRNAFVNIATNHATKDEPIIAHGGILADDMGLGKTLEMISLIVADNDEQQTGPTLIVAPLSVMSNWTDQMARHINEDQALRAYIFHGKQAVALKSQELKQYDVVITTYQTLASDYNNGLRRDQRSTGLYSMKWRRIILDEGHVVRNPQSKGAAAVMAIEAEMRWVLTGTPIVNTLKDLYCLLKFVGIGGGMQHLEVFNNVLVRPLNSRDNESAMLLLKAVMKSFVLRRKKEMAFIDLKLPGLEEFVQRIDFTKDERKRYDVLQEEAHGILKDYKQKTSAGRGLANQFQTLLEILLRMRQCCNHTQLVGKRLTEILTELADQKVVALTPDNVEALRDLLQLRIESQEECAVCLEPLHQPVITHCGHSFGRACIERVIDTQHKCPMCRAEIADNTFLVESTNECGDAKVEEVDLEAPSSKVKALMKILMATKNEGKGEKTIVFSQWTSFLDIVESNIERAGLKYTRLDGTMNAAARDSALHTLANDGECTIMLASLGVCAVGLNLVAANNIILADSWWAPAIEDQAIDRVHRLGQKRPTRVFRLVVDKSIEDNVLEIQQRKRKLMKMALSEAKSKRDAVKQGRLADIQLLLGWQD